jgi:hypothetical protein
VRRGRLLQLASHVARPRVRVHLQHVQGCKKNGPTTSTYSISIIFYRLQFLYSNVAFGRIVQRHECSNGNPPITYYWTVPLILDHSYLVGKLTGSKIADRKVSEF